MRKFRQILRTFLTNIFVFALVLVCRSKLCIPGNVYRDLIICYIILYLLRAYSDLQGCDYIHILNKTDASHSTLYSLLYKYCSTDSIFVYCTFQINMLNPHLHGLKKRHHYMAQFKVECCMCLSPVS